MQTEQQTEGGAEHLKQQIKEGTKAFNPDNFIDIKTSHVDLSRLKEKILSAKNRMKHCVNGKLESHVQRREVKPCIDKAQPLHNADIVHQRKNISNKLFNERHRTGKSNGNSTKHCQAVHLGTKDCYALCLEESLEREDPQNGRTFKSKIDLNKSKQFLSSNIQNEAVSKHWLQATKKDAFSAFRYFVPKINSRRDQSIINRSRKEREKETRKRLATELCDYEIPNKNMDRFSGAESTEDAQFLKHKNGIGCKKGTEVCRGNRQNTEHISRVSTENNNIKKRCVTKMDDANEQLRHKDKSFADCAKSNVSLRNSCNSVLKNAQCCKIVIDTQQKMEEFELKVVSLWDLYRDLYEITEQIAKTSSIAEEKIVNYVRNVASEKFEFINEICCAIAETRALMTIKLSRILENFVIFGLCLNSLNRKTIREAESINFLGYSSSSLIFLIKLLFLCHECRGEYPDTLQSIYDAIAEFEGQSYKTHFRSVKELIRSIEHNNEIIKMIKKVCGNKKGKYVEEYISDTVRDYTHQNYQSPRMDFHQCARGIFEFLSFILHLQNMPFRLPLLAMPPTPYLQLQHSKSIVIEPWGVLAYRRHDKLVIRAHTNTFLQTIMGTANDFAEADRLLVKEDALNPSKAQLPSLHRQGLNIIFWTELMPKEAEVIAALLPQNDNIHWLYRYHCRHEKSKALIPQPKSKNPNKSGQLSHIYANRRDSHSRSDHHKGSEPDSPQKQISTTKMLQNAGCIQENTIIIDNSFEAYRYHSDVGITMKWKGEKKDIKLLQLSEIVQTVLQSSERNSTTLKEQLRMRHAEISRLTYKVRNSRHHKH